MRLVFILCLTLIYAISVHTVPDIDLLIYEVSVYTVPDLVQAVSVYTVPDIDLCGQCLYCA